MEIPNSQTIKAKRKHPVHIPLGFLFFGILGLIFLFSCGEKPKPPKKKLNTQQVKQLSEEMHIWDERRQNDEINQYIKSHNYQMESTASGLRYMLMKKGSGDSARAGMIAKVMYKIYLLDGKLCYSSEQDGVKEVEIGKANIESGLHEGLQLMREGDKMRFILPSQLAHGLTGDQSKIPPLSTVVYEVELVSLNK